MCLIVLPALSLLRQRRAKRIRACARLRYEQNESLPVYQGFEIEKASRKRGVLLRTVLLLTKQPANRTKAIRWLFLL